MTKTFKQFCPLMKGTCIDGFVKGQMPEAEDGTRTKCAFFLVLAGKNPQNEAVIEDPGCAISFMPIIALEGNAHTRQVAASVDKVATEVRHEHSTIVGAMTPEVRERLMHSNVRIHELEHKPLEGK